jgi:hypothetical protein
MTLYPAEFLMRRVFVGNGLIALHSAVTPETTSVGRTEARNVPTARPL